MKVKLKRERKKGREEESKLKVKSAKSIKLWPLLLMLFIHAAYEIKIKPKIDFRNNLDDSISDEDAELVKERNLKHKSSSSLSCIHQ